MTPNEYQDRAAETALWMQPGADVSYQELDYCVLGLASEAGEVASALKKYWRDMPPGDFASQDAVDEMRGRISSELGDVMWYVAMTANAIGWSLEDIMLANVTKLARRKANGTLHGSGDNR